MIVLVIIEKLNELEEIMEISLRLINFLMLGIILILPVILLIRLRTSDRRKGFFRYILFSLILLSVLVYVFAWWLNKSNMILLTYYGYNFDGWTDIERYLNVASENVEIVKHLEFKIMGIGWPLKAMFGIIFFLPYPFIVYFVKVLIDKIRNDKKQA